MQAEGATSNSQSDTNSTVNNNSTSNTKPTIEVPSIVGHVKERIKGHPWESIAVFIILALFVLLTIINFSSSRKKKVKFSDYIRITHQPRTFFQYLGATFSKHSIEYATFVAVPLAIGLIFEVNSFTLLGLWGLLITTIGAFYAARADYSSGQALLEARKTYLSVINFADDLKSFIEKIKHDLDLITEDVSIKFLTVIPAFGTVGLEDYYSDMQRFGAYRQFHLYIYDKIAARSGNKLEILTHNGQQTVDWIFNILVTSQTRPTQRTAAAQQKILADTTQHYLEQKKYVRDLIGRWGPDKVNLRVWDTQKIPKLMDQPRISIPFQFIIVKHGSNQKVYFLFSGAYLYEFIFKSIDIPIDMSALIALTKGYYIDKDRELVNIFIKIFDGLYDPLVQNNLTLANIDAAYPNQVSVIENGQTNTINIQNEYISYERTKAKSA